MLTQEQLDFIAEHTARTTDIPIDVALKTYAEYTSLSAMEFRDESGLWGIMAYNKAQDFVDFAFIVVAILVKNEYYIRRYREMVDTFESFCRTEGAGFFILSTNRRSMGHLLTSKGFNPVWYGKKLK